jgi:hypothetical protein
VYSVHLAQDRDDERGSMKYTKFVNGLRRFCGMS